MPGRAPGKIRLKQYRLFLLEDPLMPEHRESWPLVRAASSTPLAIGEILTSRWDCLPLFQNRWIDFIRIKPLHVGGLTEARKILTLASPDNVRSAFHGAGDIGPIAQAASVHLQTVISELRGAGVVQVPGARVRHGLGHL
ncbi:MAG: enolase C-terminal domain-like protein [Armatimonas sp.]